MKFIESKGVPKCQKEPPPPALDLTVPQEWPVTITDTTGTNLPQDLTCPRKHVSTDLMVNIIQNLSMPKEDVDVVDLVNSDDDQYCDIVEDKPDIIEDFSSVDESSQTESKSCAQVDESSNQTEIVETEYIQTVLNVEDCQNVIVTKNRNFFDTPDQAQGHIMCIHIQILYIAQKLTEVTQVTV